MTTTTTTADLFETALQISDPKLYDSVAPETRAAALTAALTAVEDSGSALGFVGTATAREITLRAVCDPWSSTRKKMYRIVASVVGCSPAEIAGSDIYAAPPEVEAWLVEAATRILIPASVDDDEKHQNPPPWYAVDGLLCLIKALLECVKLSGAAPFRSILRAVLSPIVHPQECVRDTAADIVAVLLKEYDFATAASSSDDDDDTITFDTIVDAVTTAGSDPLTVPAARWWRTTVAAPDADRSLLDLGKLSLASRGIGVQRLFDDERSGGSSSSNSSSSSSSSGGISTLQRWAASEFASVRFGCGLLFTKKDFGVTHITPPRGANAGGIDIHFASDEFLSPREVEARLRLAIEQWLLNADDDEKDGDAKPWTIRETAAIAAGDLLRQYLPPMFRRRSGGGSGVHSAFFTTSFAVESSSRFLKGVWRMGCSECEPVFDVRRACAQLLPLLSVYLIVAAPDADFAVALLFRALVDNDVTSRCEPRGRCGGEPQLANSASCCVAQNLLWFLIVRTAFEEEFLPLTSGAADELRARRGELAGHCPRVRLLLAVYGRGLGLLMQRRQQRHDEGVGIGDAATLNIDSPRQMQQRRLSGTSAVLSVCSDDEARNNNSTTNSSSGNNDEDDAAAAAAATTTADDGITRVLACDVRWLADWLRLDPQTALRHDAVIRKCISEYVESHVQDLIFTALHDAAHVHAAALGARVASSGTLMLQTSSAVFDPELAEVLSLSMSASTAAESSTAAGGGSGGGGISPNSMKASAIARAATMAAMHPFLFALDPRFAPPALQQDGSDALADGSVWIRGLIGDTSSARRRRGSLVAFSTGSALQQVSRWSAGGDADDGDGDDDGGPSLPDIQMLCGVTAPLLETLLVTGKASSAIELASLLRSADATRSVIRAVATATIAGVPAAVSPEEAERMLLSLTRPWLARLDARRTAFATPVVDAASKKATASNWDDSSSSDSDVGVSDADGGGSVVGYTSAVTFEQEIEAGVSAFRHISHVVQQMSHYESERVAFVKSCVARLNAQHPQGCAFLELQKKCE